MPVSYEIDVARRVVRVTMSGDFSADQTAALFERLAVDPDLQLGMAQLVDLTHASAPPTSAESESLAFALSRLRARFEGARCAVVVAHPAMYGAIRQLAALAGRAGIDVRPFHDREAAAEWLRAAGRRPPNEADAHP